MYCQMLLLLLLGNLINPLLTNLFVLLIGSKPGLIGGFLLAFVCFVFGFLSWSTKTWQEDWPSENWTAFNSTGPRVLREDFFLF